MRRNELNTMSALTNKAEPPIQDENVSVYKFGKAVYKVRTFFNLECTETLADVVDRLVLQDLNDTND